MAGATQKLLSTPSKIFWKVLITKPRTAVGGFREGGAWVTSHSYPERFEKSCALFKSKSFFCVLSNSRLKSDAKYEFI